MSRILRHVAIPSIALFVLAASLYACSREKAGGPERSRLHSGPTNNQMAPIRGHLAPDFLLRDIEDRPVRLSDFKGKVVLINFWATWCGPCLVEMPSLEALYERNREKDFVVLAVSGDEEGKTVIRPFAARFHLTFPALADPEMRVNDLYRVRTIPASFLVDRKGYIRDILFGSINWSGAEAQTLVDTLLTL